MAARAIYPAPHVQLRELAIAARARCISFEAWWQEAVRPGLPPVLVTDPTPPAGAVRWPTDYRNRDEWRTATEEMEDVWRRAYERLPATAGDRAILELGDVLDTLAEQREQARGLAPDVAALSA